MSIPCKRRLTCLQPRSLSWLGGQCNRLSSSLAKTGSTSEVPAPTTEQLRNYFITSSIPMIGFGFMDQTVMLQAGNAIDCSIGVTFGLSTLAAAALGQVVSAAAAAIFGGTIDDIFRRMGLPRSGLTSAQRSLDKVKRINVLGNLVGVVLGCIMGLVNLLLIDTDHSSILKLDKISEISEFNYEIEASNEARKDATTITLCGPDMKGLLAAVTAALAQHECDVMEVHAQSSPDKGGHPGVHDLLVIRKRGHQVPNEELKELATALLEATTSPVGPLQVRAQANELQQLKERIKKLENIIQEREIKIVPSKQ